MIEVGTRVTASPAGPGVITGYSERGLPQVNEVTVAWATVEGGSLYDPFGVKAKADAEAAAAEPPPRLLAGVTRNQFRADVAELVMAELVGTDAALLVGNDDRASVARRAAILAAGVADPLWDALVALPSCEDDQLRRTAAIRCYAKLIGWYGNLAHRGPEDRKAIVEQSVRGAVLAARALVEEVVAYALARSP